MSTRTRPLVLGTLALALAAACTQLATPDRVPRVGRAAPDFALGDHRDVTIRLRRLREVGPVVVVFYRGHW